MDNSLHGGDLYKTARSFGIGEEAILDFSANINSLGLSQELRRVLLESIDKLVNYPDPMCNELREEISVYLSVPKESIIAGNGASEMIHLLFDVLQPRKVLMPAPCFAEYERSANIFGAEICYYRLKEEDGFRLDIHDLFSYVTNHTDTILLCNPNNPTSALIPGEDLLEMIQYAESRNVNVIIDEAFIELTVGGNSNSVVEYLNSCKNLYIIRALTKILAVPGLRLGYALGDPAIVGKMWDRKIPWSVNTFACGIGKVLNSCPEYLLATAAWLEEEKEWLYNELTKISSLKIYKPDTNFVLIKILDKNLNAAALKALMISKGILIRDACNFKFLDDKYVRVAVKERKANSELVKALKEILDYEYIDRNI